ncbi:hypothetical protein, partial [Aeromonas caviae]|uniref:hypothetical protein n=1 Tax=Aeromonas caviae TaxID=648 RepID=UPI00301571A0
SFGCGLFCLATNQIAQTGLSSLPPVIYYSEQLFSNLTTPLGFISGVSENRPAHEACPKDILLFLCRRSPGHCP